MRNKARFVRSLCVLAMTAGLGGTALAQMGQPPQGQPQQPPQGQTPQQPPSKQAPKTQQKMAGADPGAMLEQAHDSLQNKDTRGAATEMRQAAAAIRDEAQAAPKQASKQLDDAAKKLDHTAQQIESGQMKETKHSEMALAEGANALAKYNHAEAEAAMRSNDKERFSQHLKMGARDLERAAKWSGRESERGVRDAVGDAVELSGKVTEGAGAIPKDAGRVVEALGRGIDRVGKDIHGEKPEKKQSSY